MSFIFVLQGYSDLVLMIYMKGRIMKSDIPVLFMPSTNQNKGRPLFGNEYSLYFHIPFCKQKCHFCSIKTSQYMDANVDLYVAALLHEFSKYKAFLASHKINCIHFGGGTPSLLSLHQIKKIILVATNSVCFSDDVEIVFESHPESLCYKKIDYLSKLPKLTLNMGVQTFCNAQLSMINRPMNRKDTIDKLVYAQKKGFYALGIDIIAGLPKSSKKSVLDDVGMAIALGINDISLYPLRVERDSILNENLHDTCYDIPDDRERIEMIESAKKLLKNSGYYSCSIFHWTNKINNAYQYSRHQRRGGEWIGFGAGAFSYFNQTVYLNHTSINDYIDTAMKDNIVHLSSEKQSITSKIIWDLSFMTREGFLDREYLKNIYGILLKSHLDNLIAKICDLGYASYNDGRMISITSKGIVHLDRVENIIEEEMQLEHV